MDSPSSGSATSLTPPHRVGLVSLPHQEHRKSVRKGFDFTVMVVGEASIGKSSLMSSIFLADFFPEKKETSAEEKEILIEPSTVEIMEGGVKARVTVVEVQNFGNFIDDSQSIEPISSYIDQQFDKYFDWENSINRRSTPDSRVHVCLYVLSPFGRGLKPIDISCMKEICRKVNLIPVIGKADALTVKELKIMKKQISKEIDDNKIHVYIPPDADQEEDDDERELVTTLRDLFPLAVCGSQGNDEGGSISRVYPWGNVDIENPLHCDLIYLRTMLIHYMHDLKEITHDINYEAYRTSRVSSRRENNSA